MLFNYEQKAQFLQDMAYSKKTVERYLVFFNKTSVVEFLFDRDLFEFTPNEFETLFYSLKCKTYASICGSVSLARRYECWAFSTSCLMTSNKVLDSKNFNGMTLNRFIEETSGKTEYILNRTELYRLADHIGNPRDKAIICLLYEGLCGYDYSELRYLKKCDCDFSSNTISVHNRKTGTEDRIITCDHRTMSIVKDAIDTDIYIKRNGRSCSKNRVINLIPSDYVIRTANLTGISTSKLITLVFEKIRFSDWSAACYVGRITPTAVRDSGLLNTIAKKECECKRVVDKDELIKALAYYGRDKKMLSSYLLKYEIFKRQLNFISNEYP